MAPMTSSRRGRARSRQEANRRTSAETAQEPQKRGKTTNATSAIAPQQANGEDPAHSPLRRFQLGPPVGRRRSLFTTSCWVPFRLTYAASGHTAEDENA